VKKPRQATCNLKVITALTENFMLRRLMIQNDSTYLSSYMHHIAFYALAELGVTRPSIIDNNQKIRSGIGLNFRRDGRHEITQMNI
jgi:hypothetical protein